MRTRSKDFTEAAVPDQSGRTALITGANTGIGYEAARVLAQKGCRVLLGCRSEERASDARERILALHPEADVDFVRLDLGSLASVEEAAREVRREPRLDLLINNAGIMMPPRRETEDGFESQFGINHLGHFALTARLLDKVLESPDSRVVTISSLAHASGFIQFSDLQAERGYQRQGRYAMSKLANLLFALELQRRLESENQATLSVAAHPGVSNTELARNLPRFVQTVFPLLQYMIPNHAPPKAALPTLRAATDPEVQGGEYYGPANFFEVMGPPVLARTSPSARDPGLARRLWDVSVELTGVEPPV